MGQHSVDASCPREDGKKVFVCEEDEKMKMCSFFDQSKVFGGASLELFASGAKPDWFCVST